MRVAIIPLLLASTLVAAQSITPQFDTTTVVFERWDAPYVHASVATDTSREQYDSSTAGDLLSFAGHARAATELMERGVPPEPVDSVRYDRFRRGYSPTAAIPAVLAAAEDHEIAIVNEAHHEPRHRVFTRSLLAGLYARGYRHFGLETLTSHPRFDSIANGGEYPALSGGYYTAEPQFAAMVNEAKRLGFELFSYEAPGTGSPKERELGQMRNIMAYRDAHPGDKLLLHVGYSHATEGEMGGDWDKAMAQRLADTTGLDPLTVNQTDFREMSDILQEPLEYRYAAVALDGPAVFEDSDGERFYPTDGVSWFDRYVFHPRTSYRDGRPDYVFAFGQHPVYVDCSALGDTGPWLLQAYGLEDDVSRAVPRDVIEVGAPASSALALSPGEYRLLAQGIGGQQWVAVIAVE